jgi:DNA-binding HxlR family transcriptional regulator
MISTVSRSAIAARSSLLSKSAGVVTRINGNSTSSYQFHNATYFYLDKFHYAMYFYTETEAKLSRNRYRGITCSLARALDQAGDWWTLLIIRDALRGIDSFEEFHKSLGIARNILAERLQHLQARDLMTRIADDADARRAHYVLTTKGEALAPALVALMQWGDTWVSGKNNEPIVLVDRLSGSPVAPVVLRSKRGKRLRANDLLFTVGPGADSGMRVRAKQGKPPNVTRS